MKKYDAFPEPIGGYTVGRTQMDFEYTASDHTKGAVLQNGVQ